MLNDILIDDENGGGKGDPSLPLGLHHPLDTFYKNPEKPNYIILGLVLLGIIFLLKK